MKATEILKRRLSNRRRLEKEAPNLYKGYYDMMKAFYSHGAVERKYKELMAVAAAVATHCRP